MLCFWVRLSLCGPDLPGTHSVNLDGLEMAETCFLCLLSCWTKGTHHHTYLGKTYLNVMAFWGGGFVSDNILYEVKFLYNLIYTIFSSLLSKFTAKHSISLLTKTVINGMLERENSRIYMNYSFNVSDSVHVTLKHFFIKIHRWKNISYLIICNYQWAPPLCMSRSWWNILPTIKVWYKSYCAIFPSTN